MKRKDLIAALAGAALVLVLAGSVAWAAIPSDGGVYTGCMLKNVGTVRLIDKSLPAGNLMSRCKPALEVEITWNQQGPQGLPGAQGAQGAPGEKGDPGQTGPPGAGAPTKCDIPIEGDDDTVSAPVGCTLGVLAVGVLSPFGGVIENIVDGAEGQVITLMNPSATTIVLADGMGNLGNLELAGTEFGFEMSGADTIQLVRRDGSWYEVSRSDNS